MCEPAEPLGDLATEQECSTDGCAPVARGFYAALYTADELADLAGAGARRSLDEEIALLRICIRRVMAGGNSFETLGRLVARLAQALKIERDLSGDQQHEMQGTLARVLEEIGAELEQP